jgi:hypothetical protein
VIHVREEVELRIAGDLRMRSEKFGKLGIVVRHIILVGEQRRIVRHNGSEGGTETEKLDEFSLRGSNISIAWGWSISGGSRRSRESRRCGPGRSSWARRCLCMASSNSGDDQDWQHYGPKQTRQGAGMDVHFDFPR